jgi:hypothetical protein
MSNEVKVATWWEIVLLAIAYGIPSGFFVYSFATCEGHWFARSGSLMVMIGAILEFNNFSAQQYLREKRDSTWKPQQEYVTALNKRKIFDTLILSSLVVGTLIWGYGDLLFKNT